MTNRELPERFSVAFSFAGEQRDLVGRIASGLDSALGEANVFFDEWFGWYLSGGDADLKLQHIYHEISELVVVSGDTP